MTGQNLPKISFLPITILFGLVLPLITLAQETSPLTPASVADGTPHALQVMLNPNDRPEEEKAHLAYEIKPTKTLEDVLTIRNYSADRTYYFKVYAVDAIQSSEGVAAFKLEQKKQEVVGQWISFGQEEVSVKPGTTVYVPYRITIPENTVPGTYQGGLVAEMINPELPSSTSGKTQVIIVSRLVEPVYLSIPGRKEIKYGLEDFSYRQSGGNPGFHLKFVNRGNVFLKGEISLKIEGTMLDKAYETSLNDPTILQDETLEKTFRFENPPLFGDYKAQLTFKVYEYDVAKNELKLLTTLNREIGFNIIPWQCLAALLIFIILLFIGEKLRRKYFAPRVLETFTHKVKKGETIISIADLYQVNWKNIVKLNKLKRPYTIQSGDQLILPFPKVSPKKSPFAKKAPPKR
jgi:hypothetical protein